MWTSYATRSSPFSRTSSSPATTNPISSSTAGRVCIPSIDGGGFAFDGLLTRLRAFLRKLSGDPASRIADFFNLAARSGASGIFVAMLFIWASNGHPLFSANEAHCLLLENRPWLAISDEQGFLRMIFQRSGDDDEVFFRWIFGDAMLRDTMKSVLVPCYNPISGARVLSLSLSG
ncbi:putative Patatin-like protein 7 [Cocos nucifera]|nr:putative Patatin-like protein 7 [Cocos nucifera]